MPSFSLWLIMGIGLVVNGSLNLTPLGIHSAIRI
jgi:hypothetical protein